MKHATMVYRYPGHKTLGFKHGGYIFDCKVVDAYVDEGESELDAALADGWSSTPAEAKTKAGTNGDTVPPTRGELETKAIELGIEFGKRTKNAALAEKIKAALAKRADHELD